ncbi:MAG: polysaccharide biosynthesis C-terminal domain-containing protein [Bacteroidales bacterium]|nr:polysaccharide biosynthesis C-terminal domain-containing protein [Bacteroidales bacterium]
MRKQGFIESNIWVTLANVFTSLKGVILVPILINTFGKDIYGSFVLLGNVSIMLFQLSSFGIGYKYKRYLPSVLNVKRKNSLYYTQFFFHLFALFLFISLFIAFSDEININLLKINAKYNLFLYTAYTFSILLFNQSTNYFRLTHRIRFFAINQILLQVISLALIILISKVALYRSLNVIFVVYTIVAFVLSFVNSLKIITEIGLSFPDFKLKRIISDIRLGYPLVLYYIMDFTLGSSDRFIIAYFLGSTAISYYNPAYILGALITIVPRTFSVVLQPFLSKQFDESKEGLKFVKAEQSLEIYLLFAIPFVVGTVFFAKPIIAILANNEIANASYFLTPIVALGILFFGINNIFSTIYFVRNKTQLILWYNGLSFLLNVTINIVFISIYRNIIVAAISTLISYFVSFVIFYFNIRKSTKIQIDRLLIVKILLASGFMSLFILGLNHFFDKLFLLKILSSIFVYFAFIIFFKVFKNLKVFN